MKNIWIFNHYATNMYFDKAGRHFSFAKYLLRSGYNVRIFCASTIHNSAENLITGSEGYREEVCDGISFTFIKARNYTGNGKQRILNMRDYYRGLFKVTKYYDKPDVIIGSSVHPLACVAAIKLGNDYKCRKIAEIRDLWPESIIAYGVRSKNDLLVKLLYRLEKWIYTKADAIIFTMEGGRDYIIKKGWDTEHGGSVDLKEVHCINNGVDLELFDYNREHYRFADADLDDSDTKKIIYMGSIRRANSSILLLPDVAKSLARRGHNDVKILVFGKGDMLSEMQQLCDVQGVDNLVFKGFVDKKYVPYILSKADINILNCASSEMSRFGSSQNKLFEYLASDKPIMSGEDDKYSIIRNNRCGISRYFGNGDEFAQAVIELLTDKYQINSIRAVGEEYDFKKLTDKLLDIIEGVD